MTETIFYSIIIGIFFTFVILDFITQKKVFPTVNFWKIRGVFFYFTYLGIAIFSPLFWDAFLVENQLLNASMYSLTIQVISGLTIYQLFVYIWHRVMHNSKILWRFFHQMHHSAERLDVYGAYYFHPFDMIAFTFIGSFSLIFIFGVSGEAAVIITIIAYFLGTIQHANIQTPMWLGYIIQRPENHSVHHQTGLHKYNYSDLPLWDIIFGTFKNVKDFQNVGLFRGSSNKLSSILIGKDILKDHLESEVSKGVKN
jgi:sterol desaturase/sphingolipid hydroxylase (fatty acid hydroxylase superfamily)